MIEAGVSVGRRGHQIRPDQRRLSAASAPLSRRASQTGKIETATRITATTLTTGAWFGRNRLLKIQIGRVGVPGPAVNVVTTISSKLRANASRAPARMAVRSSGKVTSRNVVSGREAELTDTFGGIAAPQDVVAAVGSGDAVKQAVAETVIRLMYAPVLEVHWVTVKQLAYLEPILVEVVACMIGDLLNDALQATIHSVGVPEPAARAMLMGHVQVALANGLRGDNPFSDACLIAMDYGRTKIIKEDWKSIFNDDQLDHVLKQMLHLDYINR